MTYGTRMALLGAFAAVLTAGAAQAEMNAYVGASAVSSRVEDNVAGPDEARLRFDEEGSGWKGFAGARFGVLGIEGGYVDFGDPGENVGGTNVDLSLTGWDLFATANLDLGPALLFAKAGMLAWDTEVRVEGVASDANDTDAAYGVGGLFRLGESVGLRAEYELFDVSDIDDVTMISAGVELAF